VIYADHNATTPPLPEVIAAVAACLADGWGNPGSRQHPYGRRALAALDAARGEVAALLGAQPDGITFTSGATEACNLALLGLGERLLATRPRIVVGASEHPAVAEPVRRLAEAGAEVVVLPVASDGRIDGARLAAAVDGRTGLLCLMLANHETGVVHDLATAAAIAHRHGALVVCDATQAIGRLAVDVATLGVDALACTAHKCYGPPGVGALWLRRGLGCSPLLHGGGQEGSLRPGTPNLPGIVGFGVAAAAARRDLPARQAHLAALTGRLEARLRAELPGVTIHGAAALRLPGTSMLTMPGASSGWLLRLEGVAASGGATCSGGGPSPTLLAMGCCRAEAGNAIRISLGCGTTADEVEAVASALRHSVSRP
jgi:cysteine desulfurase